jgi:hypothetical protein
VLLGAPVKRQNVILRSRVIRTGPHVKNFVAKLRLNFRRLPKNARSNRLWVVWGGSLYFSQAGGRLALSPNHSESAVTWANRARRYVRWNNLLCNRSLTLETTGLYVTELGMFGNMSRRLANGLAIADSLGLAAVVVTRPVIFHGGIFVEKIHSFPTGPSLYFGQAPKAAKNPIDVLLTHDLFSDFGLEKSAPQSVDRAWDLARRSLAVSAVATTGPTPHLTIHVRGGDVFGPRKPKTYGQPPVAFYELVLGAKKWSGVTVVHQDLLNPVIPGIFSFCETLGIDVSSQSGTIQEDLTILLGATHLVAGRGTFAPAVAGLGKDCQEVFYFEDKCTMVPLRSDVRFVRVVDRDEGFTSAVLSRNWQNTPEQRALMLDYPASSLEICSAPSPSR